MRFSVSGRDGQARLGLLELVHGAVDTHGNQVVYWHDKNATQDSARRMFEFLQRHLK